MTAWNILFLSIYCANGKVYFKPDRTFAFSSNLNAKMEIIFSKMWQRCNSGLSTTDRSPSRRYPEEVLKGFVGGAQFHCCYLKWRKMSHVKLDNCRDYSESWNKFDWNFLQKINTSFKFLYLHVVFQISSGTCKIERDN